MNFVHHSGIAPPPRGGSLRALRVLIRNELRASLRNRTSIFWVFIFPLVLFCTLGLALGGGSGVVKLHVDDRDGSAQSRQLTAFAQASFAANQGSGFRVVPAAPGEASIRLVIPRGFATATDASSSGRLRLERVGVAAPGAGQALDTALRQAALQYAVWRSGAAEVAVQNPDPDASIVPEYRRFLFSGVLVLMLLSGGVLSLALMLAGQREQGILKLPGIWPISPLAWLAGVVGTRASIMLVAALGFVLIGHFVLGIHVRTEPVRLLAAGIVVALASLLFLAIGYLIAARTGGSAGAELMGNALYYPMLLLGDLTIPLRELPLGLDRLLHWLPTSQVVGGLRGLLWDGGALTLPWALYAYLLAGISVCVLAAGRAFRFSPEDGA